MIKFNSYPEERVLVFNPDGSLLGYANLNELYDIRCQIAESRLTGYYIQTDGIKYEIKNNGMVEGAFHLTYPGLELAGRLLRAQKLHLDVDTKPKV